MNSEWTFCAQVVRSQRGKIPPKRCDSENSKLPMLDWCLDMLLLTFFCLTNTSDLEAYLYRDNKMGVNDVKLGGSIDLLEGKEGSTGDPAVACLMG